MTKLGVLAAATAMCLQATASAQTGSYSLDFTLSKQNFVDSIRIDWVQGQVLVPVNIEGKQMRFLLDTGAGHPVVFADSPISNVRTAGAIASHDALNHRDTVPVVELPPMMIGSVCYSGCKAMVRQRVVRSSQYDGLLGFDLVSKGLNVKIDTGKRLLIVTDRKDFFDSETGFETRYRLRNHVPWVTVSPFGKYQTDVLFDTGSRLFYALNKTSFDQGAKKFAAEVGRQVEGRSMGRHAMGHSGVEPYGEVVFLNLSKLRLGNFSFNNVHTATTQGGSHMGASILDYGAVVFNPRRKRMRFQPFAGRAEVNIDNRQMEIAFVPENNMPTVGVVWEKGVPYQKGFREGDVILKIDNKPVNSFAQFVAWGYEQGREYVFAVRSRRGFMHEVKWIRLPREK